jgi:hypothetical protein
MTYLTIKTNHTLLAQISAFFWRIFGTVSVTETIEPAADYATCLANFQKNSGFGGWADDPRTDAEIIADIKGYKIETQ